MKKYTYLIVFSILLLAFTGCKKALTEKMHSNISPSNFYKTAKDAEAALNGAFAPLKSQDYYQRSIYLATDLSADIYRPANANADRVQIYNGTYSSRNGILAGFWENTYELIKNANDVILNVPGMALDEKFKANILGNAYFLRAFAHFDLVRMYGDIPLILSNTASDDLFPSRTPAKDVYAQIIKDMEYAETNCLHAHELTSDKIGRATSEAASAMLARIYLQRASTTFGETADNQKALDYCNKVITYSAAHPTVIGLAANYADVFEIKKKNGPESIFAIQFGNESPYNNSNSNLMFDPASLGGFASLLPLESFYNSFNAIDKRKPVNVGTVVNNVVWISKYRDPYVVPGAKGGANWHVMRYADVLLMQSEAMHKVNAGNAAKFDGINKVRTRAGLGASPLNLTNTPDDNAFITALAQERLWELAVEGHRRWDLIRFNRFIQTKAAQGFSLSPNKLLYPLPQGELDANENLEQNQGY